VNVTFAVSKDPAGDVLAYDDTERAPGEAAHILIWHPRTGADFDAVTATVGDVYLDSAAPGHARRLAGVTFEFFASQAERLLGAGWAAFAKAHHGNGTGQVNPDHPCAHGKPYEITSGCGKGWAAHCKCGHYGSGWRATRREAVVSVSAHIAMQAVASVTRARLARERDGEASA
jgi:hypothetical protein